MKRGFFSVVRSRLVLAALALIPLAILRADDAPKWLSRAAQLPPAMVAPDTPATVLLNETVLTVDSRGRATWGHRYAVRILTRAGLSEATGLVMYLDKKDKVSVAKAWLLREGKVAKSENQNKWFDVAASSEGTLYEETRAKVVNFHEEAVPNDVFGCETEVEGPMLFSQDIYAWDRLLPSALERYVVNVPAGWTVNPTLAGTEKPAASVSPDKLTWTWELRDRPYRPREPWTCLRNTAEAQVMVNLVSPNEVKAGAPRVFRTWAEEADWEQTITAGQCDSDPALVATVRRLVADCPDDVAKIRALAGYVQKLRYVAVNQNLARGFGYRPRKASEVHAKGFGDCKDKSNLLRSMLREAGIPSYPVAALSSLDREVAGDWPSAYQFNHAILAIQVDGKVDLPTVVKTRQWGALLFFDSTDPETFVGDLPWYLQGTKVHVIAPGSEELIRLPDLPVAQRWLTERRVQLVLTAKGTVSGNCRFAGFAQSGAQMRRSVHSLTVKELHDWATGRISNTIRGTSAQDVVLNDDAVSGRFGIAFAFGETNFAQKMAGGLSIVRLDVLNRDAVPTFAENDRRTPVEVHPIIQDDEVELALPAGIGIEELPAKSELNSLYGSYENSFEAKAGTIVFRRHLKLNPVIVPVADYPKLRQFLSNVSKADRGAVVLRSSREGQKAGG